MMAGAGAVAPFMFTVRLNEAFAIPPVTWTEMLVLLTVPVTLLAAGIGLSPQMNVNACLRISSRRQRHSALVVMRVPSIFLKGSGSFALAVSEPTAGIGPTVHPAPGSSTWPHGPEPVEPPPVLEPPAPVPLAPPRPVAPPPAAPVAEPPVPALPTAPPRPPVPVVPAALPPAPVPAPPEVPAAPGPEEPADARAGGARRAWAGGARRARLAGGTGLPRRPRVPGGARAAVGSGGPGRARLPRTATDQAADQENASHCRQLGERKRSNS